MKADELGLARADLAKGWTYPRMLSECFGISSAVSEIVEAAQRERGDKLPPVAEELADQVTLMGTYEHAGELIQSWFDAGADTLQLVLPLGLPEHELGESLEAVAAVDAPPTPARASVRSAGEVGRRPVVASG